MLDCGSQRRGGGDVVPIRACLEPCPLEGHGLGFSEKLPDCWAEDNHQNRSDERPCQTVNQLDAVIPSHLRAPARASPLNDTRIALSTGALTLRWALQCRRDYALVAIEWYDFFIFGTAAALIFNKIFFPSFDPVTGTLAAFASFAVRFTARPVGGAVFAHYGDKLGRKPMLVYSLLLMGAAAVMMGLLPGYASIGIWAPILLVMLRFAQGFGVGGEWGGAALMAVEHAPEHRRGFYGAWPQVGVPTGIVLGTGTYALLSATLSDEQFLAWGWRVPFLASALLIAVGMWIRLTVAESPIFQEALDAKSVVKDARAGRPQVLPEGDRACCRIVRGHERHVLHRIRVADLLLNN
jgi:sugar transport protein